jgi:hypothetical protein
MSKIVIKNEKDRTVEFKDIEFGTVFSMNDECYYIKTETASGPGKEKYNALILESFEHCWIDLSEDVQQLNAELLIR